MNKGVMRDVGVLFLVLTSAATLGCDLLVMSAANAAGGSAEDKEYLAAFVKKYNDTAAASKKESESLEAYFNALTTAQSCHKYTASQEQGAMTVGTVDGEMRVEDAKHKCYQMRESIRKKGTSEQACGYATLEVRDGEQHVGTTEWVTNIQTRRNDDAPDDRDLEGARQLVSCDKLPAKPTAPSSIWKKDHIKAAEEACEKGSTIAYTGTEWKIEKVESSSGDRYLTRSLYGECWYPKGPVGELFSVPPACGNGDAPPDGSHSCLTAAGKLIVK